jgi:hypothetical protein
MMCLLIFVILSAAKNLQKQNQNLEALVMSWILADFLVNPSSIVLPLVSANSFAMQSGFLSNSQTIPT